MKKTDTQILETLDKALEPTLRIQVEHVAMYVRENGLELIPKAKIPEAKEMQKLCRRIQAMINQTSREHAIAAWNKENNDLAEKVAAGADLPTVGDYYGKEEFVQDFEALRYWVLHPAWGKVTGRFVPIAITAYKTISAHCDRRLAELEKAEVKACKAIGLVWQRSTEYRTIKAIRDLCTRAAEDFEKRIGKQGGAGLIPSEMLMGLVDLD
jgi:hypothetical protein